MSRLHKAQTKSLENLPSIELCCEGAKEFYKKKGIKQVILDLDTTIEQIVSCSSCGFISVRKYAMGTNENGTGLVPLDCVDIDEAPYTNN